ncbi:MAG: hypothetical protein HKN58_11060 [Xanthomonadales bacterium]|nr:hypothetical protein [Xanthomonadales bacterium]
MKTEARRIPRTLGILAWLVTVHALADTDTRAADESATADAQLVEQMAVDKCDQVAQPDKFPERVQSGVLEMSCRTFRWFDGLFGDSHDFREEDVGGKMSIGLSWNEFEGVGGRVRYRVKADLPNFSSRWKAFLGRVDEDAYVSDTERVEESDFRRGISDNEESEWLLGLGYRDHSEAGDGWDYSVGIRLRTPPRPYAKARYQKHVALHDDLEFTWRQTLFWRDGVGYGTTTYLNTAHEIESGDLSRYELVATYSEETLGTRWYADHTWYHQLGHRKGVSFTTFVRGETDHAVSVHEYGFELTFRRQVARDWLFLNIGPTLTWPRELPQQERDASWGFSAQIEFEFGSALN